MQLTEKFVDLVDIEIEDRRVIEIEDRRVVFEEREVVFDNKEELDEGDGEALREIIDFVKQNEDGEYKAFKK